MLAIKKYFLLFICIASFDGISQQQRPLDMIEKNFSSSTQSAKPWVFWYWLHGAVSKEGITADLEAMKEVGIGGAYLMQIKDTSLSRSISTGSKTTNS